jgi:hypothetical protein
MAIFNIFASHLFCSLSTDFGEAGLDCTHSGAYGDGISGVHKYFVQAMIDDYYDDINSV